MSVRTPTLRKAVRAGIAWLDTQENLAGWRNRLDLERLNLRVTCNCVLGQLFEKHFFGNAVGDAGISYEQAVGFGFYLDKASGDDYERLTEVWQEELGR